MNDNLLSNDQQAEPSSYLNALTGPGGKFDKTKYASEPEMYEALAKGKWEADKFIPIKNKAFDDLSADYIKLREEANAQASLQELIDQMSRQQPTMPPDNTRIRDEVRQPQFDPAQLDSLIDTRFEYNEKQRKEQTNFAAAKAKLTERYGANYSTVVTKQLDELGMSEAEFNQMARTNPKLFERTFVVPVQTEGFQAPARSTHNSDSFAPQGGPKRTWDYYQKLKKDNPRVYSNPKTQTQLMKDYEDLGKDFEDGDFHSYK